MALNGCPPHNPHDVWIFGSGLLYFAQVETLLLAIEAFTAVFFIGLSLPLILKKVPPNIWYGVRIKKTLSDNELWYRANAYFGWDFMFASITVLLGCAITYLIKDRLATNTLMLIILTVLMLPYVIAIVRTLFYLRKIYAPHHSRFQSPKTASAGLRKGFSHNPLFLM